MTFSEADTYGVVSSLMMTGTDVASGMRRLIEHCNRLCPDAVWDRVAALDFTGDSDHLTRWLQHLLEVETPDESVVAFWFGIFDQAGADDRNFTRLYLAGSASYDPDDKTADWACRPAYFPKGRNADSEVLRTVSTILRAAGREASELAAYVLPVGYVGLAMVHACARLPRDLLLGHRTSRAAAVGFDSGDFITLPLINRRRP